MTPKSSNFSDSFKEFITANDANVIIEKFNVVRELLEAENQKKYPLFYPIYKCLDSKKGVYSGAGLWQKYKKLAALKEYKNANQTNMSVLIIGSGPSGLRLAIECALLGLRCHVVEKRDDFTRNNVLHLWDYTIEDLKRLGAKDFYPQFCSSSINHISIRRLQGILLKAALLLGVQVNFGTSFTEIIKPEVTNKQLTKIGWRIKTAPINKKLSKKYFDVIVGADGRNRRLPGFELETNSIKRRLAVAITANFVNKRTRQDYEIKEHAGVNAPNNPKFFKNIRSKTNIELENFVYYKSDTHYLIMTPKLNSLIASGVLKQKHQDTAELLAKENINQNELENFVRNVACASTDKSFEQMEFAKNERGDPDIAIFDFSNFNRTKNSTRIYDQWGKRLLTAIVGDSLIAPFWPDGTGIAHGFLAAMDTAWAIKRFAAHHDPIEILCERESIYKRLPGVKSSSLNKKFTDYTIDPRTRYMQPIVNHEVAQISHLYVKGESINELQEIQEKEIIETPKCDLPESETNKLFELPKSWKLAPFTKMEEKRITKLDILHNKIRYQRDEITQKKAKMCKQYPSTRSSPKFLREYQTLVNYYDRIDCQLSIIMLEKVLIDYQRCLSFAGNKKSQLSIADQKNLMNEIVGLIVKKNRFIQLLDTITKIII